MNKYIKDFLSIETILQDSYEDFEEFKRTLKPLILKLNNPTFYTKHLFSNPNEKHGYPSSSYDRNIFVKFTAECIKIMNECQDIFTAKKLLQVEYSWTYHKADFSYWAK